MGVGGGGGGVNNTQPIDEYFKRIEDVVQFAADGNTPFAAEKILQTGYNYIMASGKYMDAFKECWLKGTADKI